MLLSEVIGQEKLKQQLVDMVQHQRLSHAILFVGPEGAGALPLAIAFAQYIVSIPNDNMDASGVDLFGAAPDSIEKKVYSPDEISDLPAYHRASQLMHPDLHFSFPSITEKPGTKNISSNYIEEWREFIKGYPYGNVFDWLQSIKAENKQGNISADECQEIIKKLSFKSFESAFKVLVMWMPEYLGKEGNKLLKLIEEKYIIPLNRDLIKSLLPVDPLGTCLMNLLAKGEKDSRKIPNLRAGITAKMLKFVNDYQG